MSGKRKRHVQQELPFQTWGGARAGAGRPSKKTRSSERHGTRPDLKPGSVLLITMRATEEVRKALGTLRSAAGYRAVRFALYAIIEREHFRICHVSIQSNHLHLIVNASLTDAAGRRRRGKVFDDLCADDRATFWLIAPRRAAPTPRVRDLPL